MKKVFFGGSRKLGKLNHSIRERTDNIMSQNYIVLLGDANGADKAMQEYLAEKQYTQVLVFCSGNTCRNNMGNWPIRYIASDRAQKDFQHYAIKDKKMSEEADYGFMLWDGKSKGTLNNILNLIEDKKSVLVYFSPKKKFFTLKSEPDVAGLLEVCEPRSIELFEKTLHLNQRLNLDNSHLHFA